MRRSLWVLEVKGRNGKWGRTSHTGDTKRSLSPERLEKSGIFMRHWDANGRHVQCRIVKYVPRDRVWWRFWE